MIFLHQIKTFVSWSLVLLLSINSCFVGVYAQSQDTVLAKGNPPLTESIVVKSTDLLEWSLGTSFTSGHKSKIKQILINSWQTNNRAQIESTLSAVNIQNQISQMNPADRNNLRAKLKPAILENLQKEPNDELSRMVLDAYESSSLASLRPSGQTNNLSDQPLARNLIKQNRTNSTTQTESFELWTFSESAALSSEQAKAMLQRAMPVNTNNAAIDTKPLSFEQAIANARRFLSEQATPQILSAFSASPEARDADLAAAAAAGAMAYGVPLAALTALLRAHELKPQDATHLANLAAVLSYLGLPREALSILDSPIVANGQVASPLEMGGQAAVFNTRGFSLLKLGQAKEAEAVLRKAIVQSPHLNEVKTNLGFALWAQDDAKKKEEGARLIAAVWRRNSPNKMYDIAEKPHTLRKDADGEIPIEIFEPDRDYTRNLDISRGKRLKLPDLKIPANLEDSVAMYPKYTRLKQQLDEMLQDEHNKAEERFRKETEKLVMSGLSSESLIARARKLEAIKELLEIQNVQQHATVRPHWEKLKQIYNENYSNVATPIVTSIPVTGTAEVGAPGVQLYEKFKQWQGNPNFNQLACSASRQAHSHWRPGIKAYDIGLRAYLQAAYKYMTGVAANIASPGEHELVQIDIERNIYSEWRTLVHYTNGFHHFAFSAVGSNTGWCAKSSNQEGEILENLHAEKADRCPDALKGKNKATLDLVIAKVSINCESIGVEASPGLGGLKLPGWISGFVELEAKFKNGRISKFQGMTVVAGVKVGLDKYIQGRNERLGEFSKLPVDLGAKAGAYVKIGSDGEIVDGGIKLGGTVSTNTSTVAIKTGVGHEFSFLPAFQALDSAIDVLVQ